MDAVVVDAMVGDDTLKPAMSVPEGNVTKVDVYSVSQGAWLPGKLLPLETKPDFWVIEFVKSDGSRSWKDFPVGVSDPHLRGLPLEHEPSQMSSDTFKPPASAPKEEVTAVAQSVPGAVARTPIVASYTPAAVDSEAVAGIMDSVVGDAMVGHDTLKPAMSVPEG